MFVTAQPSPNMDCGVEDHRMIKIHWNGVSPDRSAQNQMNDFK